MPTTVQFRRGTTAQNNAFTGANGEISVDTSDSRIVLHDGSTAGGSRHALASETIFKVNADDSTGLHLQGGTDVLQISGGNGITTSTSSTNVLTIALDGNITTVDSISSTDSTAVTIADNANIEGTLQVNSTINAVGNISTAGSFVIGSASINETDLEKIDGITDGTVAASKAVVVDSNKDATGFRNITVEGSFIIGSADMNETDLEKLDGITNGTAAANKALVVDASKDIGTLGTVTASAVVAETISSADSTSVFFNDGITLSGPIKSDASSQINIDDALDVEGAITSGAITSSGSITAGSSFIIGSADINETDLEKLDGITNGTAAANKALVADANIDVDGVRNLTATGTVQAATITATGTLNADIIDAQVFQTSDSSAIQINEGINVSGAIVGASTANISGDLVIGGAANIAGNLTVSGTTTYVDTTNVTVADPLLILSKTNSGGSDVDAGIMVERGSAGNNAVFYFNEGDDKWKAVLSTSGHDATAITDSSTATVVANIEGDSATITTITTNEIVSGDSSFVNVNDGLNVDGNIQTTSGNITAGGSFIIGSADINETDLEKLDGITDGTAAGNKALVVDANKDIGTIRNITSNGTIEFGSLSDGSITATAFVDEDDMSSNSATLIPTQQSVKAYVDSEVGGLSSVLKVFGDDSTTMEVSLGSEALQVSGGNSISTTTSSTQTLTVALDEAINVNSITSLDSTEVEILNIRTDTLVAHDSSQITIRDALRVTGTITGTVTSAQYADLAEIFATDDLTLVPGDVVCFTGNKKVSMCDKDAHHSVAGVVSTEPGFLLNEGATGVKLAMTGRVPCKIQGIVEAGDLLVSAGNGRARSESNPAVGTVIGKAVEDHNSTDNGVIDIMVNMM